MTTVLLAWELGGGLGHVQKLLRVARSLAGLGQRPVFACANVVEPWVLFRESGFPLLQAPLCPTSGREQHFVASSLADVLAVHGWDEVDRLLALVSAWERLVELVQPKVIVGDFIPTLCLAVYRRLPVVLVDTWFSLPPIQPLFPLLVPGQPSVISQERLLAIVQEVQRRRGQPVPDHVPDILGAADCFPAVLPEVDGYREHRSEPTWDPLEPLPPPLPLPAERRFFAYLAADLPQVEEIVTQLALTGCLGTVYLRGSTTDVRARLRLQGLEVLDRPAAPEEALRHATVVVHHGGLGMTHMALAAGRPQLLLPRFLEQLLTSERLRRLGIGMPLAGNYSPQSVAAALEKLLGDTGFSTRAAAVATSIANRPRRDTLTAVCERCRAAAGGLG